MQLTLTTDYAIRMVYYLALENEMRNTEILANSLGIPASYVPKVTKALKKAGILEATEGIQGGYRLKKPPKDICLLDIIRATEKTIRINRCLEDDGYCSRQGTAICPIHKIYKNVQTEFEGRFSEITIAELLGEKRPEQKTYLANFIIDIDAGTYINQYSRSTFIEENVPDTGEYRDLVNIYIQNLVHPDEKERVREFLLSDENLHSKTKENWKKKIRYRRASGNAYVWMEGFLFGEFVHDHPMLLVTFHNAAVAENEMVELHKELVSKTQELEENFWKVVDIFKFTLNHVSKVAHGHSDNISHYTKELLCEMKQLFPELLLSDKDIDVISRLSCLHDIGKMSIPSKILNKAGPLSRSEIKIMRKHVEIGGEISRKFPAPSHNPEWTVFAYNICRHHHERFDGSGYPDGLKGNGIPLCAQVVSVVDAYDALIHERSYNPVYSHETAVKMILHGECGTFSDRIKESFVAATKRATWHRSSE